MRILIKGGVWKNTEDEILKAAVMKYGKNQWARVASLLNRKSAKQCKARWYEWLDPSIKKTEWTREEEEKLLHLAKLMPNQWRTIVPIVGRTAAQCMEHYEKLLDQAQDDTGEMAMDDPRRLRPGEIDPAPESKPARPDPIDMDEDEKEMLSEARARLANTKGKKAKRKARERMLEESRRLAVLQKRRELKAAGVESRLNVTGGKRKYMDYTREIAYQKTVPSGFYDVSEENEAASKMSLDPKTHGLELSKMEGRHEKEEEERQRKRDKKIMQNLFKENAPAAILKISEENDPTALRRRVPLELPSPQVTENELEEIVKLGKSSLMGPPQNPMGISATQALIGDYSQAFKPTATPLRTPQQEDIIMQEAKNLRILREMTPLVAQELPELYEGTGFGGVAPRKAPMATPNTLLSSVQATPSRNAMETPGMSISSSSKQVRDQFGLNNASAGSFSDNFSVSEMGSVAGSRGFSHHHQAVTLDKLVKGLPKPEYTYEIGLPELPSESEEYRSVMSAKPEDAADIALREQKHKEEIMRREQQRQSSVMKLQLPRAKHIPHHIDIPYNPNIPKDLQKAASLINEEMIQLITYEELKYPSEAPAKLSGGMVDIRNYEIMEYEVIQDASKLIEEEMSQLPNLADKIESIYQALNNREEEDFSKPQVLAKYKNQFNIIQGRLEKDLKRSTKLNNKFTILTQGYQQRSQNLQKAIEDGDRTLSQMQLDAETLKQLKEDEMKIATSRLEQLRDKALKAEYEESLSQQKYASVLAYARACGVQI